jgi:aminoglycoside phosphotransferase family enzyme/predicted kinase
VSYLAIWLGGRSDARIGQPYSFEIPAMELSELMENLANPAAYPYGVRDIEIHQTHISAVFLAGPYAYKIKKPVHPQFLDFSTLEKRRFFCDEEVRLNRRLAADVYLGVVAVVRGLAGLQFEGEGEIVEWAVKMQRLSENATFQERLRRGEITVAHVETLARKIAAFHREADANERIAAFGRFDAVSRIILDVYDLARPQVGTTVSGPVFNQMRLLAETTLARLRPLIETRAAQGVPRDCHGDLHLDHVYLFPDRAPPADLVIIDCIEFNERFRYIDPVADMAFAFMDFVFWGRRDLALAFASAYFRAFGDGEGRALLPLYTAYRATVRGAVEGMLLTEKEVPEPERTSALARARAHWLLALAELDDPGRRPCLVLVAGLPGTGKTVLGRGLAEQANCCTIRSDLVRKELAGLPDQGHVPPELRDRLYSPESSERTYAECLQRAEALVFAGNRVVVDASFHEESRRQTFLKAATRWGVPSVLLLCQAQGDTVWNRLKGRRGDASDADWSVYESMARRWQELGTLTRQASHTIATDGDPQQSLDSALAVLRQCGLLT